ncbi:uncharacterized protein LOC112348654 [Selaginella moellendorffii]|uniref:uncharacterized protein LOC112348654 n=1 Tax=Selaginella moellendorffii TaxID=88036 RepID=UPI000D1D02ED|nr:uncharacterized protein LOC112348654 [Selaginella moellendorffii]|eukprot:XP_024537358.1 uncharacterized protein LOC112348654 [Selaginella moellendorffii]
MQALKLIAMPNKNQARFVRRGEALLTQTLTRERRSMAPSVTSQTREFYFICGGVYKRQASIPASQAIIFSYIFIFVASIFLSNPIHGFCEVCAAHAPGARHGCNACSRAVLPTQSPGHCDLHQQRYGRSNQNRRVLQSLAHLRLPHPLGETTPPSVLPLSFNVQREKERSCSPSLHTRE